MKNSLRFFLLPLVFALTASSWCEGAVITLPQLSSDQIDPLFRELAADLAYRPVEGAARLGRFGDFGFEIGTTVLATSLNSIASIIGPSNSLIPGAFLDLGLGLPGGFGIELGFIPSISYQGTTFKNIGGNLRWNFSRLFPAFPFDLALRGMFTSASLGTIQPLQGGTINVDYSTSIKAGTVTIGKTLGFFEPYLALGYLTSSSTLSYSGSAVLFGQGFQTGTTSVTAGAGSVWFNAGFQLRLFVISLGLEYDNLYGNDAGSFKFAFRF